MRLPEKKLQKLKENKLSVEKLNDQYFSNSRNTIEIENILKLLNGYKSVS